ncbi:hypothetical protein T492DRAFT_1148854 [Pavlovales sp. CCMP2436]|nr:hypothetical protein T492DRAFT_1148854 [Pavlovales sp. CCMP2436]
MASASGTSTGRRRRLYRASVSPQAGARASAASEVSTNMSLAGGLYLGSRRWLADRRTWAAVVFMCCVVGVGCWLSIEQDRLLLVADRSNVQRLADSYALNLAEQLRAAVGTTLAVGALAKVEGDSLSEAHFILLATRLLRFYPGIGELQFSPYGVIKFSHSYSGKATAPGLSLFHQNLLAPGSRATIRAYPDRLATTPGPQELVDGDLAVIIRHPIFTTVAPRTLPLNETYVDPLGRGADAELGCATEEEAEANCYFSGPDEDGQTGTHFYAFATALARMDRLFEPVGLKSLHIDHGFGQFLAGKQLAARLPFAAPEKFTGRRCAVIENVTTGLAPGSGPNNLITIDVDGVRADVPPAGYDPCPSSLLPPPRFYYKQKLEAKQQLAFSVIPTPAFAAAAVIRGRGAPIARSPTSFAHSLDAGARSTAIYLLI